MQILSDRVLVLMDEKEEKLASGIILPENKKKQDEGVVVLVGVKVQELKVGDRVRKFRQAAGVPIEYNGADHLLLSENGDIELKMV